MSVTRNDQSANMSIAILAQECSGLLSAMKDDEGYKVTEALSKTNNTSRTRASIHILVKRGKRVQFLCARYIYR